MTDEREKFIKKLAQLGEEDVRQKHEKNHFGAPDSKRSIWTTEWLKGKEKEAQDMDIREKEARSTVTSGRNEKTGGDSQSEHTVLSPAELDVRRKKAVKTVIVVGLISVLIFLYALFSGS